MLLNKEKTTIGRKYKFTFLLGSCLIILGGKAFSQAPLPPPQPPPSPVELFNKINPFKKHKKTNAADLPKPPAGIKPGTPPGPPPPPPNPLDLFKKKKADNKTALPTGKSKKKHSKKVRKNN